MYVKLIRSIVLNVCFQRQYLGTRSRQENYEYQEQLGLNKEGVLPLKALTFFSLKQCLHDRHETDLHVVLVKVIEQVLQPLKLCQIFPASTFWAKLFI